MKRPLEIFKVIVVCILVTNVYAIIHDQIAFSISKDFFCRYVFYQYGIAKEGAFWIPAQPRLEVFKLSVLSSWWIGTILALLYCFVGFSDSTKDMRLRDFKFTFIYAFLITILISTVGALIGSVLDFSFISSSILDQLDNDIVIHQKFLIASYMDKFSYVGASLSGLITSFYLYKVRKEKPITTINL